MRRVLRVQTKAFDASAEIAALGLGAEPGPRRTSTALRAEDGGSVAAPENGGSPERAEAEIGRVAAEAERRWPLDAILVIHRTGMIAAGEAIVLVATASAHRGEAFDAAEFLMDYLKTRAPFWKKAHRRDGSAGDWVAAKEDDEAAVARWVSSKPTAL